METGNVACDIIANDVLAKAKAKAKGQWKDIWKLSLFDKNNTRLANTILPE